MTLQLPVVACRVRNRITDAQGVSQIMRSLVSGIETNSLPLRAELIRRAQKAAITAEVTQVRLRLANSLYSPQRYTRIKFP